MPRLPDQAEVAWEVAEFPLVGGVDLRPPGRLVQAPALLRAENVRFDGRRGGLRKRRGHVGEPVRTLAVEDQDSAVGTWTYGLGVTGATPGHGSEDSVERLPGPKAGALWGSARRDDEVLQWDGWRLFSGNTAISACMPTARVRDLAKVPYPQWQADLALASDIGVVTWIDDRTTDAKARYTLVDPATLAPLSVDQNTGAVSDVVSVRAVPCGDWVHVLAVNGSAELHRYSYHRSGLHSTATVGTCPGDFDVRKVSETEWILVHRDGTDQAVFRRFNASGHQIFTRALDVDGAVVSFLSVDVHPLTGELGLAFGTDDPTEARWCLYGSSGEARMTPVVVKTWTGDLTAVTITPRWATREGSAYFQVFVAYNVTDARPRVYTERVWNGGADQGATRIGARLGSQAFRVGDAPFVWLQADYGPSGSEPTRLQRSHFLVDRELFPVGRVEYGLSPQRWGRVLPSVHFSAEQDPLAPEATLRNRTRFHGGLVRRTRVDSKNNDQYDEESVRLATLDFLPKLHSAQFGRSTYFPGAQLHQYDGAALTEASIHWRPENLAAADSGAAGNPTGTYQYVARWAWKGANGEEVRSAGVISPSVVVSAKKIQVTVPTFGWTRKTGVYLLLYRNADSGTTWHLVTSRDPSNSGYVANNPATDTLTFLDNTTDLALLALEDDTITNAGELEPLSPPASEVIAVGKSRLWLAGGELPPGDVLPSKYGVWGRASEWNQALQTTVHREAEPITALAHMGVSTLVFQANRIYAFEADGPDNLGIGGFDAPRVIATDTGAVASDVVLLTTDGVWYQARSGLTLLATNYQIMNPGEAVFPEAAGADFRGAVVMNRDQEIRFYRADGPALVWHAVAHAWTTWPGTECHGVVLAPGGDAVVLAKADGTKLTEAEGVWTDGGRAITLRVRTAWLRPDQLQGYTRFRRAAYLGDLAGECTLHWKAYYDDRDFPEDEWTWNPTVAGDLNTSEWGDATWGAGLWGDADASGAAPVRDRVLGEVHRLARQKCARISLELDDGGAHSEGPAITAVAIELAKRPGLTRIPARGSAAPASVTTPNVPGAISGPHT